MSFEQQPPGEEFSNVYTPSELNHEARLHLEAGFGTIWLEGEISNFFRSRPGHLYFSLKDDRAQISCALFRSHALQLGFNPADGMLVRARGRVSLYEERGNYQLIAESLVQSGEGQLQARFELLKKSLATEGLFDQCHKKPLPRYPLRIAVITSPAGAALRDIMNVLSRRWPMAAIRVYGVPVQGQEAVPAIERALNAANRHSWAEVIIAGRGGGSLEDLWAFNEERVARAIFASTIPVISAVGHEIDFSISDFTADVRAPTPSAAAELVSPDQQTLKLGLMNINQRLCKNISRKMQALSQKLDHLSHRLKQQHPGQRLKQHRKQLQQARIRLLASAGRIVPARRAEVESIAQQRLLPSGQRIVPQRRKRLKDLARTLNAVSPLPTLARGYAIVQDAASDKAISSISHIRQDQLLVTQLDDGQVHSTVTGTSNKTLADK